MGAQMMYNALLENNCSEQASRMSAMESSTKNATEMLSKLTLTYNRCPPPPRPCAGRGGCFMSRQPIPTQQAASPAGSNLNSQGSCAAVPCNTGVILLTVVNHLLGALFVAQV